MAAIRPANRVKSAPCRSGLSRPGEVTSSVYARSRGSSTSRMVPSSRLTTAQSSMPTLSSGVAPGPGRSMVTRTTQPGDSRTSCTSNSSRPWAWATRWALARICARASIPPEDPLKQKSGPKPTQVALRDVYELLMVAHFKPGSSGGPDQQVVAPRSHDFDVHELAGRVVGRIAFGEVDHRVDVGRLRCQPPAEDQVVLGGRAVDDYPDALADPRLLRGRHDLRLPRHQAVPPLPLHRR